MEQELKPKYSTTQVLLGCVGVVAGTVVLAVVVSLLATLTWSDEKHAELEALVAKSEKERASAASMVDPGSAPTSGLKIRGAVAEWLVENDIEADIREVGPAATQAGDTWAVPVRLRGENTYGGTVDQTLICYLKTGWKLEVERCQ